MTAAAVADAMPAVVAGLTDDLRRPPWRGSPCPLAGHCYVAAEALYHLTGRRLKPCTVRHEGGPHWYLADAATGAVIDPTAGQFLTPPPYHLGRGCGFLTRYPSRRAAVVIARAKASLRASASPAGKCDALTLA